jgi:predicted transcriptional regulator/histone H3/H4
LKLICSKTRFFTMKSNKLNSANPDHITYEHPPVEIAVLGGIRLEGLDRMRVTLKVQIEHLNLRHNLDLYNDNQTEKLIRKIAERLEIGTSVVAAALIELTDALERYRLEELERMASANNQNKRKVLNPEEIKAAKQYLSAPNLMERTKEDIGKAGVIGEHDNRVLMYLIFTSRKRDNPLHVISLGSSGIGKTHLQEKVSALIPEEDKLEITTLSGNAFYYFGQQELRNKLILIEDLDGAEDVLYPLREIKSKRKITKTVVVKNTKGETRTVSLVVEGPVCVAGCTTKESLYEDNANRSFLVYIDESKEQDGKIMDYQRKLSAGKIDLAAQWSLVESFQNMQRVLQPITIRNPYAEKLQIPHEVFKPRRSNAHYLAFVEAVTFYHQYQRESEADSQTGEIYINTTLEDIEEANKLMKNILLRKSDQLNGATRDYFEKLKAWMMNEEKETFMNREIRTQLKIKGTTLRRYHYSLLDVGLIRVKSGKKSTGFQYEIITPDEYKQLKQRIDTILDEVLAQCRASLSTDRCATAPGVSHTQNGSLNGKKASKIKPVRQRSGNHQPK